MRRIRKGEAVLAVGAVGLFALLFAGWFSGGGVTRSGWSSLGWGLDALIGALLLSAAVVLGATIAKPKPAIVVAADVITATLAILTLAVALLRVLIFQPALDLGLGNDAVSVQAAGYLGLVALALIAVGSWMAVADERTSAPDSAYTPPPPRPVPGS